MTRMFLRIMSAKVIHGLLSVPFTLEANNVLLIVVRL